MCDSEQKLSRQWHCHYSYNIMIGSLAHTSLFWWCYWLKMVGPKTICCSCNLCIYQPLWTWIQIGPEYLLAKHCSMSTLAKVAKATCAMITKAPVSSVWYDCVVSDNAVVMVRSCNLLPLPDNENDSHDHKGRHTTSITCVQLYSLSESWLESDLDPVVWGIKMTRTWLVKNVHHEHTPALCLQKI